MIGGRRILARAGTAVFAAAVALGLTCGLATAQDEIDVRRILDTMLGTDTSLETEEFVEPVVAAEPEPDPDPDPNPVSITPAGPSTLVIGNTLLLSGIGAPDTAASTWVSGTPAVATVTSPGLTSTVTGVTVGSSIITATGDVSAAMDTTTINVVVATVSVSPTSASIAVGAMTTLMASSDATLDVSFTWLSNDSLVATVDGAGVVTAVGAGSTTIDATGSSSSQVGSATITVTALPVTADEAVCFIATAAYGTQMAGEIRVLRQTRDTYLLNNALGAAFTDAYYRLSPPIADLVAQHPWLAALVRLVLMPVVFAASLFLAQPVLTTIVVAGGLIVARRRKLRTT